MHQGKIVEQGTYAQLIASGGPFSRLVSEFGGTAEEEREKEEGEEEDAIEASQVAIDSDVKRLNRKHMGKAAGTGKLEVSLNNFSFADIIGSIDGV